MNAPAPKPETKTAEVRTLAGAKCQPGHLRTAEQSGDFASLDYETMHPWESILAPDYFLPAARLFLDGRKRWLPREIRIFRMVSEGQRHWWEIATVVVSYADPGKSVTVKVLREPTVIGAPAGIGLDKTEKKAA